MRTRLEIAIDALTVELKDCKRAIEVLTDKHAIEFYKDRVSNLESLISELIEIE